ncbi:MAG: N-acetylmuramoyl-L-alanine amidase [Gammaproteobacteria bacterium]
MSVKSLRFWTAPDHTRLVFDASSNPVHEIFLLENPRRLVIDIKNARLSKPLIQPPMEHSIFSGIRSGIRNGTDLRIVLDLKRTVSPKSFALQPNNEYGHRLVVDLFNRPAMNAKMETPKVVAKTYNSGSRDIVVAIDAGHGGEDPGAHGPKGTQEKKVVLEISKKLAGMIDNYPGMRAVLIRKGDYYVGLRKRMDIARDARADLFVSIHADAFKNSRVQGASVFTLSSSGASNEAARWLANQENASDLVGGVSLDDKDDVLASVLLDLSQTAAQEASVDVAGKVLRNFGKIGKLHQHQVQKAGFVVLKSPDIPSILVETAYISNPSEELKLKNSTHQQRMAKAIFEGILDYFGQNPPSGTRMASTKTKHVISRGETLSGIAMRYGVSMKRLRDANSLASNRIQVGQVLEIPSG